ncbi:DUF4013 domain-containing protein [Candidatus Woesearchaeota archaeon]|nr:DUF4013 domain-containing protein [Candidatus Woesearchaeota archaeon]
MVNYGAAFKLPFTNWRRLGALFLLVLVAGLPSILLQMFKKDAISLVLTSGWAGLIAFYLAFFLVSMFLYMAISGYSIRIARHAAHGKNALPPFEKFLSLFAAGFKYSVALLIYSLPLVLLLVLSVFLLYTSFRLFGILLLVIAMPFAVLWMFFIMYSGPMLMAHFAYENRFAAFFELGRILKYSFTMAYFVPWIVALGYSIALFIPYFVIVMIVALISYANPSSAAANVLMSVLSGLYTVILTPTVMNLYGQAYHDVKAASPAAAPAKAKGHAKSKSL